jgi:hypothetical protein
VHQIEGAVDLVERHHVRDERVDLDAAVHVQSTIFFGTSVRPRAPPKAAVRHTRPVTSWNGRVEISAPAGATPTITLSPQPLWQHSSAWRIVPTLPMHSKD